MVVYYTNMSVCVTHTHTHRERVKALCNTACTRAREHAAIADSSWSHLRAASARRCLVVPGIIYHCIHTRKTYTHKKYYVHTHKRVSWGGVWFGNLSLARSHRSTRALWRAISVAVCCSALQRVAVWARAPACRLPTQWRPFFVCQREPCTLSKSQSSCVSCSPSIAIYRHLHTCMSHLPFLPACHAHRVIPPCHESCTRARALSFLHTHVQDTFIKSADTTFNACADPTFPAHTPPAPSLTPSTPISFEEYGRPCRMRVCHNTWPKWWLA